METFHKLFGSLLAFVYHCFDRIVIQGYLPLLTRPAHVVHFFRDVHGIYPITKEALAKRTNEYRQHLESLLPLWMRPHYLELKEAFKEDLEQLLSGDTVINSGAPMPLNNRPAPTCLEEELDTFFATNVNDRKKGEFPVSVRDAV